MKYVIQNLSWKLKIGQNYYVIGSKSLDKDITYMKSFLIVNHPVPSVGLGGKVEDSLLAIKKVTNTSRSRAVGGSENLEVPILFGGDNLPPLVEIGLSDLPKSAMHAQWFKPHGD